MESRAYGNSRFAAEEGEARGGALMQGWDHDADEVAHGKEDGVAISRRKREVTQPGANDVGSSAIKRTRNDSPTARLSSTMKTAPASSSSSNVPTPVPKPIHSFFADRKSVV